MPESIRFDDGAAYERFMGRWSRLVGDLFLDWLALPPRQRWLDVGCGNGAFTALLLDREAPAFVEGIDPSEAQLAYATAQLVSPAVHFQRGDAMTLPVADGSMDAAVMPLVIFFVPDPAAGVAEMVRVVRPGGTVAAYAWDMPGGGFPYAALHAELHALGVEVSAPPSAAASRLDVLQALWADAGLQDVSSCTFTVQRTFADFDDYWATILGGPSVGRQLASLSARGITQLQAALHARLPAPDAAGRITVGARANAIRGAVPAPTEGG